MSATGGRWIDVFAGAGGFTTGAMKAGAKVVDAVNHWGIAIETHAANHPRTVHHQDNALKFDFSTLNPHDFGHLSPECTHYAQRARGGKISEGRDESRSTASCVVRYARACRPRGVTVENVTEYGASDEARDTVEKMTEELGYHHQRLILDAMHFGTPQSRKRLFEVFTRRKIPLLIPPVRTTFAPASIVIDLTTDGVTGMRWSAVDGDARHRTGLKPLCERTLRQVAEGAARFDGAPFLVPYYGSYRSGETVTVYPLSRPIGTLTTVDRYAVCRRGVMSGASGASGAWQIRMLTPGEMARAFGFPEGYWIAGTRREKVHQIGNAVCVDVAEWLTGQVMGTA